MRGAPSNRREAGDAVVHALAHFERTPVPLPVAIAQPDVMSEELEPVVEQVRTAVFGLGPASAGRTHTGSSGPHSSPRCCASRPTGAPSSRSAAPAATRYFKGLARAVNRQPKEASFKVAADEIHVKVVPSGPGRKLDTAATSKALLAGALSTQRREANLVVVESHRG